MAAMIQTFPQQTGTITLLQTRPSSASGIMPGHSQHSQPQPGQQYGANPQVHRNSSYGVPGAVGGQTSYRGISGGPVQPYAFTSTPALGNGGQWQTYGALRTTSTPSLPTMQMGGSLVAARPQYQTTASTNNLPSNARMAPAVRHGASRDDMSLPSLATGQQSSTHGSAAGQLTFAQVVSGKAAPERYRRTSPRTASATDSSSSQSSQSQGSGSALPSGSGMATVVHLYNPRAMPNLAPIPRNSATLAPRPHSTYIPGMAVDDMVVPRQPTDEELKRMRRRSMHSFDSSDYPTPLTPQEFKQQTEDALRGKRFSIPDKHQKAAPRVVPVPAPAAVPDSRNTLTVNHATTAHTRNGSSESLVSSRSSNSRPSSSTNRNPNTVVPTTSPASAVTNSTDEKSNKADAPKSVNVPPRSSSSEAAKRVLTPSPLSKPATMASDNVNRPSSGKAAASSPAKPPGSSHGSTVASSPAAKQLAAINEKGGRPKGKTSRLRRAFSFGSAADFKKAADQDDDGKTSAHNDPAKLRKEPDADDLYEQEQARIAQKQEASGLGNSIYSGTKIFAGSTDNLSISSTASSASIMLRKMGKGMKKGGRSLVGLFRPKSIIGAPIGEVATPEASQATVSMITVEAERERVNVNSNADLGQHMGGTGFPRLERNSLDAKDAVHVDSLTSERLGSSGTDSNARKSIVGGEKERAEVLGAIRKGILKTRSNSPSPSPQTGKTPPTFELPMIPNVSDSPSSSAPSTPGEEAQGHRRNGSVTIGNEDYFMSALRLRQDSKSAPGTPQGGLGKRNATFSPRLIFHDTWPPQEYDRRGEIATCNRLTPMLAQQIKEELNSFKMEMEVHETSKIYTHFF
ncbi:hypothetical protein JX265_007575 [Neoarthrinium moseri]|uniref:Protein BNI4 n=1 Tax=Neoarthrinium moseri TaxID=1658444 RepID=A0A9Q0APD0_9PEZI|nr:hypothetical protein JX265_007575 [Neoarthrinium moseri]